MNQYLNKVAAIIDNFTGIPEQIFNKVIITLFAVLVFYLIKRLTLFLSTRKIHQHNTRYIAIKTMNYLIGVILTLFLLRVWTSGFSQIITYIGILSAGLAIALQKPILNFAGWFFIIAQRPFTSGNRIEINGRIGDVVDIGLFQFSMIEVGKWVTADQSTGRIIHVPNGIVFSEEVINYHMGFSFIWDEISVTITFESKWEKAKKILLEIVNRHVAVNKDRAEKEVHNASSRYYINYNHLTPIVWTKVIDSGIVLTMRYPSDPRKRRLIETEIWEDVLREFSQCDDIDFAYPSQRFYFNPVEGKKKIREEFRLDSLE